MREPNQPERNMAPSAYLCLIASVILLLSACPQPAQAENVSPTASPSPAFASVYDNSSAYCNAHPIVTTCSATITLGSYSTVIVFVTEAEAVVDYTFSVAVGTHPATYIGEAANPGFTGTGSLIQAFIWQGSTMPGTLPVTAAYTYPLGDSTDVFVAVIDMAGVAPGGAVDQMVENHTDTPVYNAQVDVPATNPGEVELMSALIFDPTTPSAYVAVANNLVNSGRLESQEATNNFTAKCNYCVAISEIGRPYPIPPGTYGVQAYYQHGHPGPENETAEWVALGISLIPAVPSPVTDLQATSKDHATVVNLNWTQSTTPGIVNDTVSVFVGLSFSACLTASYEFALGSAPLQFSTNDTASTHYRLTTANAGIEPGLTLCIGVTAWNATNWSLMLWNQSAIMFEVLLPPPPGPSQGELGTGTARLVTYLALVGMALVTIFMVIDLGRRKKKPRKRRTR